ncbi:hypothetical protein [Porphyrobacter sp. GA68]|uniref:hypothetical protein n=1 Tax=Porphyrobacter sp. GA68 TaxID=2883480 RepID=UPI001D1968FD|nr:hypothetical protein [Porphyrobacter sp. GA68]
MFLSPLVAIGCDDVGSNRPTDLQVIEACLAAAHEQETGIDLNASAWVERDTTVNFDAKLLVARWPTSGETDLPFTCEYRFGRSTPDVLVTFTGNR